MNKNVLRMVLTAFLLLAVVPVNATDWQTATDTVWAGRNYREKDGLASGYSETDNYITWSFEEGTSVTYVVHLPSGHVRSDVVLMPNGSGAVKLNVRIVHPASNTVIIEHTVESTRSTAKQNVEILPDTELKHDGWYRIEFTSPNARTTLSRLVCLTFQRTSSQVCTAANSMMAPAVHLWWSTTDPKAPAGESFDWVYMEALIPEALKQSCTYQMVIGSSGLYSGIQTNHLLDNDTWTHAVIASAWDAGDVDKNKTLPDYMRSGTLDVGPEAYGVRFGGEGTGSSLRYPEGQRWQTDHWVQMLLHERPDYIETKTTNDDGTTTVTPFRSTLLTWWYKQAEETEWHYFGTIRMAGNYKMEGNNSGMYSFLENWSGFGGDRYRRVYYRNGAMRSTASGKWFSLNHAGFGSTQKPGVRVSRDDYGHGVTALYDNSFYIESGGLLGVRDSADTYEPVPQGQMPWVDTIDVQALRERVDQAVLLNSYKNMRMRVEATRVISDPATWTLVNYSDEETSHEGDYGRAAQILDGNTSSYYRNKYYSKFPHTFLFDAGKQVTVTSIGLYQSMDLNYRAKVVQVYVSEDNANWTNLGRFSFDNEEAPTITFSEPVTARYFRCRFISGYGYGNDLAINEIYFKNVYRLADLKQLAADIIAEEDCFSGYRPEALSELKAVYADGQCTDAIALREAIERLGQNTLPLTWGLVDKVNHITSFTAYQFHNPYGYGDLVVDEQGKFSISGATDETALDAYRGTTRVSAPLNNWLMLRSEAHNEYYIYNLGAKKYLHVDNQTASLSEEPMGLTLQQRNEGYTLGPRRAHVQLTVAEETPVCGSSRVENTSVFELRNNYGMAPADEDVRALLEYCEEYLYGEADGISEAHQTTTLKASTDVVVYNVQGQKVWQGRYGLIPSLPSGVYVVQAGNRVIKRLVRN